ncbi:MAG: hypothetical protein ACX94C_07690 [Phycisphaerales bacterium]
MTDRKFIMVLGLPRGGTSLVAKMLIELGVNMGESFVNSNHYPNYEDVGFHKAIGGYAAWGNEQKRADCVKRVREYMHKRLDEVDGPVGAKFPCISNLYGAEGWDTLPIRVVRVVRPLEDAIESDLKNYTGKNRDRTGKLNRAAEYGRIWWSQQRFLEHYRPGAFIDHESDATMKVCYLMNMLWPGHRFTRDEAFSFAGRCMKDPAKWRAEA